MPSALVNTTLLRRVVAAIDGPDADELKRTILQAEARVAERLGLTRQAWFASIVRAALADPRGAELLDMLECFPVADLLAVRSLLANTVVADHAAAARYTFIAEAVNRALARLVGLLVYSPGEREAYAGMLSEAAVQFDEGDPVMLNNHYRKQGDGIMPWHFPAPLAP